MAWDTNDPMCLLLMALNVSIFYLRNLHSFFSCFPVPIKIFLLQKVKTDGNANKALILKIYFEEIY